MSDATMRAAVCQGGGKLAIETRPRPEPGPGRVRVRLLACGVCGTDLHFHQAGLWPPGHVPGHEMMGEVEARGEGVESPALGTRVAIEPFESCGRCSACLAGADNVCPDVRLHGVHTVGGFADCIDVPAARCFPLAGDLAPAIAAFTEPVAVAVHGLRRGGLAPGERVLVIGAGTIGLVTVLAARALGAGEVWISARHPHQAEHGRALGASRVLSESEAQPAALAAEGRDAPIDLVVETVGGHADTLGTAIAAVRPGGRVSVLGVFMGDVAVPSMPLLVKEGALFWSNCYGRTAGRPDFADAAALVAEQRSALAPLATHDFGLDEIGRAFETASQKGSGAVKVTVLPG